MSQIKGHTIVKAPNGLDLVLNQPDETPRDSGFFAPDSKHTSMNSTSALTPSSAGYHSSPTENNTPSPIAMVQDSSMGQPLASPASAMSVASMVSPTTAEYGSGIHGPRNSTGYGNGDSRRESVSSSVYQNMGDLRIHGGASPYTSANPSTTSLQESLSQQRNPGGSDRPGYTRFSNSYQPATARGPVDSYQELGTKKAPAITGPAPGSIARAAEATKGQAWAFPEEEVQRYSSGVRASGESQAPSYQDSRRSSVASIASSQYTTESRYPASQRRLEDGRGPENTLSRVSSEAHANGFQHHHHQLVRLQSEEASSPTGSAQPYSRTPELRVTHKLAERKRRTEMKDLFEKLGAKMPGDGRSTKSSKWEILSKAISEHDRMSGTISSLNNQMIGMHQQVAYQEQQLRQFKGLETENSSLKNEVEALKAQLASAGVQYHGNQTPSYPQWSAPPAPPNHERQELPPIRTLSHAYTVPQAMTGVEYAPTPSAVPLGDRRY